MDNYTDELVLHDIANSACDPEGNEYVAEAILNDDGVVGNSMILVAPSGQRFVVQVVEEK